MTVGTVGFLYFKVIEDTIYLDNPVIVVDTILTSVLPFALEWIYITYNLGFPQS